MSDDCNCGECEECYLGQIASLRIELECKTKALEEIGGTPDADRMCLQCLRWVQECDHLLLHPERIIRPRDPRRCVGAIARRALSPTPDVTKGEPTT